MTLRLLPLLLVPLTLPAQDVIEAFGLKWRVPIAADWQVERRDGFETLRLTVPRPSTQPRRPTQYALAETPDYVAVTLEMEAKKEPKALRNRQNSLIFVYAWRDKDHFNYAHLSDDKGTLSPHHNGIFHVFGGERVRISSVEGPATLIEEKWYRIKLDYDGRTGKVQVWVDGETSPSFVACDMSLGAGKVGLGSFFDTGEFRKVTIRGRTR